MLKFLPWTLEDWFFSPFISSICLSVCLSLCFSCYSFLPLFDPILGGKQIKDIISKPSGSVANCHGTDKWLVLILMVYTDTCTLYELKKALPKFPDSQRSTIAPSGQGGWVQLNSFVIEISRFRTRINMNKQD